MRAWLELGIVAGMSVAAALPIALALWRRGFWLRFLVLLAAVPMALLVPEWIVAALLGPAIRLLPWPGLAQDAPLLLAAFVAGLAWAVLILTAVLSRLDPALMRAAVCSGAGPVRRFGLLGRNLLRGFAASWVACLAASFNTRQAYAAPQGWEVAVALGAAVTVLGLAAVLPPDRPRHGV